MKTEFPRAIQVEPLEDYCLKIKWDTGETLSVDLGERIKKNFSLKGLLDPKIFSKVHIADQGTTIEWMDAEFGADNVYAWSREQGGGTSHEMFFSWMNRNGLNLDSASSALGMSRRMIAYYRCGRKNIPKHVWLACLGWEHLHNSRRKAKNAA